MLTRRPSPPIPTRRWPRLETAARSGGAPLLAAIFTAEAVQYALHHSHLVAVIPLVGAGVALWRLLAHRPAYLPVALVAIAGLVPYSVSIVGKSPFSIVSAMGGAAALSGVLLMEIKGREADGVPLVDRVVKLQLAWLGVALISTLFSGHNFRQAANTTRQWLFAVPVMYMTGRLIARRFPKAMQRALGMVVVLSALAFAERFLGFSPYRLLPGHHSFPLQDPGRAFRGSSLRVRLGFYHASNLSRVLTVAFPLVLATRIKSPHPSRWTTAGVFTIPGAILLTLTFQAWAGTLAALGILLAVARGVRRPLVIGLVVVGALGFALGFGAAVPALVSARLRPSGANLDERQFRLALIPAAEHYAATHAVMGAGPGTFNFLGLQGTLNGEPKPLVDDSTFAAELVEVGYPGLIAFVVMLGGAAVLFWERRGRGYYPAVLAGLVAWTIIASAIDALAEDQSLAIAWLLIGLGVGASGD